MHVDGFDSEPVGAGGDALLATLLGHLMNREGPVDPAELELISTLVASLEGRASADAMSRAQASLSMLHAAVETSRTPAPRNDAADLAGMDQAMGEEPLRGRPCELHLVPDDAGREAPPPADPDDEAATCPASRLVELARRPHPSARLCGMIVARGHAGALATILRNPEARFAKSSLTTIVELAASDMSLREAMCGRADLSDAILERLWPYLSIASKSAVLAAGCARSHAEARVICESAGAEEADEVASDSDLRSIADWTRAVRDREESLSYAMRTLDQQGRIVDVAAMLAEFSGIRADMALALMIGAYDRGTVALARIAGCDDDSLLSLMHLRGRAGARSTADRRGPVHAFARLGEEEARKIVSGCFRLIEAGSRMAGAGDAGASPGAETLAA
jgi:hypothetical protein